MTGRTIVITGASDGIGAAAAKRLSRSGEHVVVVGRSPHKTAAVAANNAGGMMGERQVTVDGHELTFQVNHLAPFLLTTLLLDRLIESRATVLNTSSLGNKLFGQLDMDDLEGARSYRPRKAYGDAKMENILFAKELHRRYHASESPRLHSIRAMWPPTSALNRRRDSCASSTTPRCDIWLS